MSVLSSRPVEKEIKKFLGIPKHLKIAFALRLGYPAAAPTKTPQGAGAK